MQQRVPFQWGKANFAWETNPFPNQSKNPFTWDDCALIIEVVESLLGGKSPEDIWKDKQKKKRFITLIMKCESKNINFKETKEITNL